MLLLRSLQTQVKINFHVTRKIDKLKVIKIILIYSVPYIVFTFSSVQATIFNESKQNRTIYQSSNLEAQKIQVPEIEENKTNLNTWQDEGVCDAFHSNWKQIRCYCIKLNTA